MSWFSRITAGDPAPEPRSTTDDFWFKPLSRRTSSGIDVTPRTALAAPVVHDCLTVLSQTVSTLPWAIFERTSSGDQRRVDNHPVAALFQDPDGECTSHEFFAQMVWDLAGEGNALYEIQDGRLGAISRLPRIEPNKVRIERLEDGSRRWTVTGDGPERRLVEGEVWHLRDLPLVDRLFGMGRLFVGREAIGALLAVQEYGSRYIANDAVPPVWVQHPGNFADQASRDNFLNALGRFFGLTRRSPMVLEHGMQLHQLGHNHEESQFLETRKELQVEVARLWRMPPHKVGILERATFSNIEHQALEFVTDTLAPWLELIESSVNRHLISRPDRYFFEFDVSGLLRGDIKARFQAYATARQWGWMNVNEIRGRERMNGIGAQGDRYLQPMNMVGAGEEDAEGSGAAMAFERPRRADLLDADGRVVSRMIGDQWERADAA